MDATRSDSERYLKYEDHRYASPYASSCQRCVRPWQNLSNWVFWDVASLLSLFQDFFFTCREHVESISNVSRESSARRNEKPLAALDPLSQINNDGNARRMEGIPTLHARALRSRAKFRQVARAHLYASFEIRAKSEERWCNVMIGWSWSRWSRIVFDYLANWNYIR